MNITNAGKLDEIDKEIQYHLQTDARTSMSKLAAVTSPKHPLRPEEKIDFEKKSTIINIETPIALSIT